MKFSKLRKFLVLFLIPLAFVVIFSGTGAVHATTVTPDTGAEEGQVDSVTSDNNDATTLGLSLSTNSDETSLSGTLQILLIITVISLAPSILVMVTSFTRIIIVLHFVRTAIGTQSSPPNNVLIGLSLFLTLFIMSPVIAQIKTEAYDPLVAEEITQQEALERGIQPLREFMLKPIQQLLETLNFWCQKHQSTVEIVVNDWAMADLLTDFPQLHPILGVLINKRRKDPRLSYKKGELSALSENSINADFYRNFLA